MQGQQNHSVPVRTGYTVLSPTAQPLQQRPATPRKKSPVKFIVGGAVLAMLALFGTCGWLLVGPMFTFRSMIEDTFAECGAGGSESSCREATGVPEALGDIEPMRSFFVETETKRGRIVEIKFGSHCSNLVPGIGRVKVTVLFERGQLDAVFMFALVDGAWAVSAVLDEEAAPKGCST